MATRKAPPAPPVQADPKRREWTIGALRTWGASLLPLEADRVAWLTAWRLFEAGEAPCPVTDELFGRAVAEFPDRTTYPLALTTWQRHHA